ncbi:unnamed protein product, partial [Ectocarpus sp. 13 AM-2016]
TGKFPGGGSTDKGSEGDWSEESLLEDSGEHQLARLRRNPKVKEVISRLKSLSTSLIAMSGRGMASGSSTRDDGVEYAVRGSRANTLRLAQQEYLRLFEEMLAELLRLQREKAKAFRAEKLSLQRELARAHQSEAALKDEAEAHSVQLEALLAVKKALDTEVATQEVQLTSLSAEVETHARMENVTRREHFAAEHKKAEFLNEMKQEEQALRTRFKEVEVEATRSEMGVRSMEHLVAKVERAAAINRQIYRVDETKYKLIKESSESFSQTMANDDGLWDYQDGRTRNVSRNILQRLRWQALRRFASCPSCHGLGPFTIVVKGEKKSRKLAACKDRAQEDPTLMHQERQNKRKRGNLDKNWAMPNVLVEFMCHLPKTAVALPIKPLRWLTRQAIKTRNRRMRQEGGHIWLILDERERIDTIDEQEGQPTQNMNDFMMELFLRRHGLRQDAELQLYIFLVSLKTHYKKTATVHTFARLMDLLNDYNSSNSTVDAHSYTHSVPGHDHDSKGKNLKDKREHFMREEELLEQEVQPHRTPLGPAYIPVLLFTRRILLKRAKVDVKALHRERIRQRFMSAASSWRMQEAAASAFKEAGTEVSSDESVAVIPSNDQETTVDCQPDASTAAASTRLDANPNSAPDCSTIDTTDSHDPSAREEAAQHTWVAPTATGHGESRPPAGGSGSVDT